MNHLEALNELLFDLIRINEDRVECYENLIMLDDAMKPGLYEIFHSKVIESKTNLIDLKELLQPIAGIKTNNYMSPGKLFCTWRDTKKIMDQSDPNALLEDCGCGEEAALEAYKTALSSEYLVDYNCRRVLMDQKFSLQSFKIKINKYSDLQSIELAY